jgi:uncharacterized membrane protein (UPF0127 family)
VKRFAGAVFVVLLFGCPSATEATAPSKPASPPPQQQITDVTDPNYKMEPLPIAKVVMPVASGGTVTVDAEVCADEHARTRGLMWRRELAEGKGMLFLFPQEQWLNFWMRNTLIPLDMVFIDSKFEVAGIVENAAPQTLTGRGVGRPSKYVLEVPGGWTAKVGLKAGAKVKFEGTEQIKVTP